METGRGIYCKCMQGIISGLKAGEIRNLQMTVQLAEEQAGELIHTVTVKAKYPGKEESIGCQKSVETEVIALKAAFEVEKTADRTQAYPGDTITYQICIRNTVSGHFIRFSVQKDSKMPVFRQTLSGKRV